MMGRDIDYVANLKSTNKGSSMLKLYRYLNLFQNNYVFLFSSLYGDGLPDNIPIYPMGDRRAR